MKYLKKFENEDHSEINSEEGSHYMFFNNIDSIKHYISEIEKIDKSKIADLLDNGHDWAADHLTSAKEYIKQVFEFLNSENSSDISNTSDSESERPITTEIQNKSDIVDSFNDFNKNN